MTSPARDSSEARSPGGRPTQRVGSLEQTLRRLVAAHQDGATIGSLLELRSDTPGAADALERHVLRTDRRLAVRLQRTTDPERRLTGIKEAVSSLGFRPVHSAVLAAAVMRCLGGAAEGVDVVHFWRTSVATAVLAQIDAQRLAQHEDEAFAVGLLHRVGRLLLAQSVAPLYSRAVALSLRQGVDLLTAEVAVVGFTEVELAAAVGLSWRCPPWLVDAVAYPQRVSDVEGNPRSLEATLWRARVAAQQRGFTFDSDSSDSLTGTERSLVEPLLLRLHRLGGSGWLDGEVDKIMVTALPGRP